MSRSRKRIGKALIFFLPPSDTLFPGSGTSEAGTAPSSAGTHPAALFLTQGSPRTKALPGSLRREALLLPGPLSPP